MTRSLCLLAIAAVAAVLIAACGSGGAPSTGDTPRSERQYRQASIMQQQDAAVAQSHGAGLEFDIPAEITFGHREGLPFTRNVVGDPDAPVLIVEYSDFQ